MGVCLEHGKGDVGNYSQYRANTCKPQQRARRYRLQSIIYNQRNSRAAAQR